MGLSQGGRATLLNALQSEPDQAIVSSGYSILEDIVATDRNTCMGFSDLSNVKCAVFNGGHQYPVAEITDFLKNHNSLSL